MNSEPTTMHFEPKVLNCTECHCTFNFSAGEQEFFHNHGLSNEPKRCPNCRILVRMRRTGQSASLATQVKCAECGDLTTVPFQPSGHKPIYCSTCFMEHGYRKKANVS